MSALIFPLIKAHVDSSLRCSTPGNFSLPIALVGNLVERGLQSQPHLKKKKTAGISLHRE